MTNTAQKNIKTLQPKYLGKIFIILLIIICIVLACNIVCDLLNCDALKQQYILKGSEFRTSFQFVAMD